MFSNNVERDYFCSFNKNITFMGFLYRFLFDPGFQSVFLYRIYSSLYPGNFLLKFIAKILWRFNVALNSCYLMPQCKIGSGLCLPHPVGVVIGEGVELGNNITLYQNVTLGVNKRGGGCYPKIESDVTIYTNSIVYGDVVVSKGTVIPCNSVINKYV
jgi:serine O-acetyltransferase